MHARFVLVASLSTLLMAACGGADGSPAPAADPYDPGESTAARCTNGLDDDGDGAADCGDADCQGFVFCAIASIPEDTAGRCENGEDDDLDGLTDCDDPECQFLGSCSPANGFPLLDPWGARWDAIARPAATWSDAKAACEALGGRLPTATELHRNNAASGTGALAFGDATPWLWTRLSAFGSQKALVRLSDGATTRAAPASLYGFRCIWPPAPSAPGFGEAQCAGRPGEARCVDAGPYHLDARDRPALDHLAATNECAFLGASLAGTAEMGALLRTGLPNGGAGWRWTADPVGTAYGLVAWSSSPSPWLFEGIGGTWSAADASYAFRCIGLADPAIATPPAPNCFGACFSTSAHRAPLVADGADRAPANFENALAACRGAGGALPTYAELTDLVHAGLPGGTNAPIWTVDVAPQAAAILAPKWAGAGTDAWDASPSALVTWTAPATELNYRCVFRPRLGALPTCGAGQAIRWDGTTFACEAVTAGDSGGNASPSGVQFLDGWGNAWDAGERASSTAASAVATCTALGGRLPTPTELFAVRFGQSVVTPLGTAGMAGYLWSSVPWGPGYRVVARLSDGGTSYGLETSSLPFRCIWPATRTNVLSGASCYGPPGASCLALGDLRIDALDRASMLHGQALEECALAGGHLLAFDEWIDAIEAGATGGSGQWMHAANAQYDGRYGNALVSWSGTGSANWTFAWGVNAAFTLVGDKRSFRCGFSPTLR
jgi:hypothetical protein